MRKIIVTAACILIGVVGLAVAFPFIAVIWQEHGHIVNSKLTRCKFDIAAIEMAVNMYKEREGRYPVSLTDLTSTSISGHPALLRENVNGPWGAPYQLQLVSPPSAKPYKIWTTVDRATEDRLHVTELSSETDWHVVLKR